ncbi:sigma-70 family RNA polymerase sigma factor [Allorhizocola rhizosphaerae]|uniref:sigma-70 family RNA polymerase sigma factor n=1 Tax=Allorhizocola rhizosphaerae TaxID=1872709 RepID=UPI001FEBB4EA|nr:sigma-70 family RNA polymerase sigma factor [Allorhizocola rhizosphaerae]
MRISRDLTAASAVPLVLGIVAPREHHGYSIMKGVRESSGGRSDWADGLLYPLLHRLERLGYLESIWRATPSGRRRKYYRYRMSHPGPRWCSEDVEENVGLAGHGQTALAVAVPAAPAGRGNIRPDLEQVFRTAYPRVVAVAARVLGSRDEAEDVAQEVFLAFGRSSVPAGEAVGWLSVATAHTALNHLRSSRRRASREEAANRGDGVWPDVADAVVTLDERRRVRAALARLPRKQAVALVLRHSGLSYAEVAAALDLSVGSVGTTVRRAESNLRKELNRHASSD